MKRQTNQKRLYLITAAIALLLLCGSSSIFAQAGAGKDFDARDPRPCGNLKGAAPSQSLALNSFICHTENVDGNYLHLVENASLQIGAGRPYNMKEDYNVGNIDATQKVYPIRGSFKVYTCTPPSDYMKNKGRNCSITDHPHATGLCIKDTWGDWLCSMGDVNLKIIDMEAAPPGGAAAAADTAQTAPEKNAPAQKTVAPKNARTAANPPAENKNDEKTDNGFPKPDFSEVEKYVDVIRYEYGDNVTDHNLYIVVKSKANNLPEFCAQFLDKDGIMIDASDSCGTGIHMGYMAPQAGQTAKFDVNMPYGDHMKRVASVRIVAKN